MRETRTSGSEGGAAEPNRPFLPLSSQRRYARSEPWAQYMFSGLAREPGGTTRFRVAKNRAATVRERFRGSLDLISEAKKTR
jgi:hypothetical protein